MARLSDENLQLAREIIGRYPKPKSALIPLLHLAQEQDGMVTDDAMRHLAELLEVTPAEVLGTCSFYEMFKLEAVGRYQVNICTSIACMLVGGDELLHHAEESLGIKAGGITDDDMFSLEGVECIAACTEAPCLQVNYRYSNRVSHAAFDELVDDIRDGVRVDIPEHGTLGKVRQHIPVDQAAGVSSVNQTEPPAWLGADGEGGE
jgi:NADH-quinone oxidoreductase subunit E